MKFLENYFSSFLSYQDLGDCSLCDLPVNIELHKKNEVIKKDDEHKQIFRKNFLKKVSMYLAMPMAAGYILIMQLIGD